MSQPGHISATTNWSYAKGSSPKPGMWNNNNIPQEHDIITLNDVKNVAKNNPIQKEALDSPMFKTLYR